MARSKQERAITPVAGVALLLGIVVILGAFTFGAVAFGVDQALTEQTQAHLSATPSETGSDDGAVTITHDGGSALPTEDIDVATAEAGTVKPLSAYVDRETLEVGDRVTLTAEMVGAAEDGDRILVRWEEQGQSLQMASAKIDGPDETSTPTATPDCAEEDDDRGHGNDCDGYDEDNPGNGPGGPGKAPGGP